MSDVFYEGMAERAHLKARAPFDRAAALLEESTRSAARAVDDLRLVVMKLRTGLTELEREVLEAGEASGVEAASKMPKAPGRKVREKPDIAWCHCSLFQEPHLHHNRPEPDEVAP